jgi:ribosome-associated protein
VKKSSKKKVAPKKSAAAKKPVKKLAKTPAAKAIKKPAPKKIAKKAVKKTSKKVVKKVVAKKVAKKAIKAAPKKTAKKIIKKAAPKKIAVKRIVAKKPAKKIAKKTVAKKLVAKKASTKKTVIKKSAVKKAAPTAKIVIAAPKGPRYSGPPWPLMDVILDSMEDSKAEQIIPINVEGRSSMADGMVIASGRANRHVAAIAEQLVDKLKAFGQKDVRVEGLEQGDWVLVDAGNVIVHIFRPEVRSFYNLEKLWSEHAPIEQREDE